ncbi:ultraviolet-B receptor UVR8 [Prunus avium]|uniref:Ultraviolet-B receptor UVR8 n=1 Tax=Prunus avium TaxID=42229 RepID=A0A6P5SZX3_PRUAV|nr:ultraviolet-B receptor UVR8 [Prunus avium]
MDKESATLPNGSSLSRKVVAVAAGEAHTLALTGDGFVYSWGRGMFGRLGSGAEADEFFPVRIKFNDPRSAEERRLKLVGVAAGSYHSLALADDGSVWCWGYNIYGQLGVNGENFLVPCLLERFLEVGFATESEVPLQVCSVKAGGMMSLAIDNLGGLWMWGNCPLESSSNEGGFSLVSSFTPTPVWDFHGHTVVKVACGNEHVVALVSAGETYKGEDLVCFSWGGNNHGQLGLGDKEYRNRPEIVEAFNQDSPFAVYEVACGAFHTALLTHRKRPSDTLESMCWTFGLGENGQLGHGTTQSVLSPETVKELPQYIYLVSVDCGLFHTSVVSSAGDVWSWGMEKGLGLCPEASYAGRDTGDAVSPIQINGLNGPRFQDPVQVVCGAAHTVLVANDGYKLWSWGRGRSGLLGNGKTIDCYAPTVVSWPPLTEDFKQEELNTVDKEATATIDDGDKVGEKNSTGEAETEKRLSLAMKEMKLLQSKLSAMEKYAGILHGSIFGKPMEEQDIPVSLQNSGSYDIAREWENMLESADRAKIVRLEKFYRNMLAGVKDKLMKKRIQEIIKECLNSSTINRGKGDV